MSTFVKLKEDMQFSKELQEMIEVLKTTTATQFRSLQHKRKDFEQYKFRLEEFLRALEVRRATHPFLKGNVALPKAIVMITSDEGFLGSLNALVINAGLEQASGSDELIVLGERGARYLSETQKFSFTVLPGIGDDITYSRAVAVRDFLISKFSGKKIGAVLCAYPRFLSFTVQRVEVTRLLPCNEIFGFREGIKKPAQASEILMEPSFSEVVEYIVRAWLMQKLYDMFWESKLSECAARIIHLEGSHEEILAMSRKLIYQYFKFLHSKSDKNIREIFASRLHWEEEKNVS